MQEESQEQEIHHGFTCDVCGVSPIKGVRFHSLSQRNYDICSNCEKHHHTEHPMIRFRKNSHRGLAHGHDWNKLQKIMQRNDGVRRTTSGPNPVADVINFFTSGLSNGFARQANTENRCGAFQRRNTNGFATPNTATPANNVAAPAPRANLCHIRPRAEAPVETQASVPRHARFEEFRKVFTTAIPQDLDAFLHKNVGKMDENALYNLACSMFLN